MILSQRPVTIAEAKSHMKNLEEKKDIADYFRKFATIEVAESNKLVAELQALNNLKLNAESIVKIADFLPVDNEELSKVLNDVSLSEEESQAVISIVKKYS